MLLDTHTIPTDTALEVLADPLRRSLVTQLVDGHENVTTLAELVDRITPGNPPPESPGVTRHDALRLELVHTHLPTLEDAGVVEYDARTGTIRYHPDERVEKLLEFVTAELE